MYGALKLHKVSHVNRYKSQMSLTISFDETRYYETICWTIYLKTYRKVTDTEDILLKASHER